MTQSIYFDEWNHDCMSLLMITYAKVGRDLSKIIYDTCQSKDPPRSASLLPPQRCRLLLPVVQSEALLMAVGSEIVKQLLCSETSAFYE